MVANHPPKVSFCVQHGLVTEVIESTEVIEVRGHEYYHGVGGHGGQEGQGGLSKNKFSPTVKPLPPKPIQDSVGRGKKKTFIAENAAVEQQQCSIFALILLSLKIFLSFLENGKRQSSFRRHSFTGVLL